MPTRATSGLLLLLLLATVAFWPSYLSALPAGDMHMHAHAGLMLLWFAFLLGQPMLIRAGRRDLHRLAGRVSYLLVPVIAVQSILLAHVRFQALDAATLQAEGQFLFLPLSAAGLFVATWGLGVMNRRQTPLHARYMLGTALPLIDPVVARLLFSLAPPLPHPLLYTAIGYGLTDVLLLALWLRAPAGSPARRAFGVLLVLFVTTHGVWFTVAQGPTWLAFSHWFSRLGAA